MISQVVSVGMWFERFVIIVVSLQRDYLPSSWGLLHADDLDIFLFVGTMGQFAFLMFGFLRVLPMINAFEVKELWHRITGHHGHGAQVAANGHGPSITGSVLGGGPTPLGSPAAD